MSDNGSIGKGFPKMRISGGGRSRHGLLSVSIRCGREGRQPGGAGKKLFNYYYYYNTTIINVHLWSNLRLSRG